MTGTPDDESKRPVRATRCRGELSRSFRIPRGRVTPSCFAQRRSEDRRSQSRCPGWWARPSPARTKAGRERHQASPLPWRSTRARAWLAQRRASRFARPVRPESISPNKVTSVMPFAAARRRDAAVRTGREVGVALSGLWTKSNPSITSFAASSRRM